MAFRFENLAIFSLAAAVRTGSTTEFKEIEKWLERHGENPEQLKELARRPNDRGETFLMLASKRNHLDVIKYLVERYEVDVDQPGNMWWTFEGYEQSIATALHAAVILGHEELVRYLVVDCKAKVNAKTDTKMISPSPGDGGNTPLHFAATYLNGSVQENIIRCLVQNGADLSNNNNAGNPCWALTSGVDTTRSTKVLQLLGENGVNIHQKDHKGLTPIMVAAIGTDGQPNLDVFAFLFDQESQPVGRREKIEALELLGATLISNNTYERDLEIGLFVWKRAIDMRYNMRDEPPLPKPIIQVSERALTAVRGVQEVENIQQLEAIFDRDALRVQAILTYLRILGPSNNYTWNLIDSYAAEMWHAFEDESSIDYSLLLLECTQALNEPLLHQTINAMHHLVVVFYHLIRKDSPPEGPELVNFSRVMSALYCVTKELKLATEEPFSREETKKNNSRDLLLVYVVHLAALIVNMQLTADESFEFKRCLFQIVRQGKRSSRNGRCLLLLACSKYDYTLEFDNSQLTDNSEDLRLGLHPNAELIRLLIEVGANPDSNDSFGNRGLHILAGIGERIDSPTLQALLEGGAHADYTNIDGETMMDILFKDKPREENTILICPMQFPALKCLSARVVRRNFFPGFDLEFPAILHDFAMQH